MSYDSVVIGGSEIVCTYLKYRARGSLPRTLENPEKQTVLQSCQTLTRLFGKSLYKPAFQRFQDKSPEKPRSGCKKGQPSSLNSPFMAGYILRNAE